MSLYNSITALLERLATKATTLLDRATATIGRIGSDLSAQERGSGGDIGDH